VDLGHLPAAGCDIRIEKPDRHTQRTRTVGKRAPDGTVADCQTLQPRDPTDRCGNWHPVEFGILQQIENPPLIGNRSPQQGKSERQCMIGNLAGAIIRHVADWHPARRPDVEIDIIHADPYANQDTDIRRRLGNDLVVRHQVMCHEGVCAGPYFGGEFSRLLGILDDDIQRGRRRPLNRMIVGKDRIGNQNIHAGITSNLQISAPWDTQPVSRTVTACPRTRPPTASSMPRIGAQTGTSLSPYPAANGLFLTLRDKPSAERRKVQIPQPSCGAVPAIVAIRASACSAPSAW